MAGYRHPELNQDFLRSPSIVDDIYKILQEILQSKKMDTGNKEVQPDFSLKKTITKDSFLVLERLSLLENKNKYYTLKKIPSTLQLNRMTFMRQIDLSNEERMETHKERASIANNYRKLANSEYRAGNYDKAIEFFTSAINYVVDSPVLYVNRSLCSIKKRDYKRGIMDLDYVLYNLDGRCLRAWLYRAGVMKRMNDEGEYERCVAAARRFNRTEVNYIEYFLEKMKSDF
ncbi:hypothetical protein KR222_007471 [Zaprionus bogoriensis]|nr:hypothetical protein KR222_007471 [Zaprionus bogoriensis]